MGPPPKTQLDPDLALIGTIFANACFIAGYHFIACDIVKLLS